MSTVNVRRIEVGVVVTAPGPSLDLATSAALRQLLEGACPPGGTVVLDLSAVTFADSSALGVMVSVQRRLQAEGGSLVLVRVDERVLRVMRISGLLRRLPAPRTSGDPAPGDPAPGDPAPGRPAPGDSAPGDSAPGESAPGAGAPGPAAPSSAATRLPRGLPLAPPIDADGPLPVRPG